METRGPNHAGGDEKIMPRKLKKSQLDEAGDDGEIGEAGDGVAGSNQFAALSGPVKCALTTVGASTEAGVAEVASARAAMARIRRSLERLQQASEGHVVADPVALKEIALERIRNLERRFEADALVATLPEVAQLLEDLHDLMDDVACVVIAPVDRRAAPDPAGQFKLTLPAFSGRPDELASWKAALVEQFAIAGVTDERRMVAILADGALLPARLRPLATTAGSWPVLWERLAKAVPFRQVRAAVCNHVITMREVSNSVDSFQVADFCAALAVFNQHCLARGREADTKAWILVELLLTFMGPLRTVFFDWEDMKSLDEETTDTLRIEAFLQGRVSSLGTHRMIEARKDGRPALMPPNQEESDGWKKRNRGRGGGGGGTTSSGNKGGTTTTAVQKVEAEVPADDGERVTPGSGERRRPRRTGATASNTCRSPLCRCARTGAGRSGYS